jgi:hypothetical protein
MLDARWWRVALTLASIHLLVVLVVWMGCSNCTADERCRQCAVGEILICPALLLDPVVKAAPGLRTVVPLFILLNSFLWGCVLAEPVRWWFGWPPRRFSLRTLLIATTLVAILLGLVTWLAS